MALNGYITHLSTPSSPAHFDIPHTQLENWDIAFHDALLALPTLLTYHCALIASLQKQNHEHAQTLLNTLIKQINEKMDMHQHSAVKPVMRVLVRLINKIESGWQKVVIPWQNEIADRFNNTERRDWACWMVLDAVVQSIPLLRTSHASELDSLLETIDAYMKGARQDRLLAFEQMKAYAYNPPYKQVDELAQLFDQVTNCKDRTWEIEEGLFEIEEAVKDENELPAQLTIKALELPLHSSSVTYWLSTIPLRILDESHATFVGKFVYKMPNIQNIEYHILSEPLVDMLNNMESNHEICAKQLINQPLAKHTSLTAKYNFEQVIIETVLKEMFRMPTSDIKHAYYVNIIIDLCKLSPSTIPIILGRVFPTLFDRLQYGCDLEVYKRFRDWFSMHLSNFGYRWNWPAWQPMTALPDNDLRKAFLRDILARLVRLSYAARVTAVVGEGYSAVMPAPAEPVYKFKVTPETEDEPGVKQADTIQEMMKAKATPEEIKGSLVTVNKIGLGMPMPEEYNEFKLSAEDGIWFSREVFTEAALFLGSKTFSHALNVLERYSAIFLLLNKEPAHKAHTVRIVIRFWQNNTQFMQIMLDKLTNYRVISPSQIIDWVFSTSSPTHFQESWVWDVLHNALFKVVTRQQQIKTRYESQEKMVRKLDGDPDVDEEKLNKAKTNLLAGERMYNDVTREQKDVFITVFKRFVDVLVPYYEEHNVAGQIAESDAWWHWLLSAFREFNRKYHLQIAPLSNTIGTMIMTPSVPIAIRGVFEGLRKLHE